MVQTPPRATAPTARALAGLRLPPGGLGSAAVAAAVWAVGVCLSETPTAVYSFCGTCRGSARAHLYGEAAWAVGASAAAALVARLAAPAEFRVARSAAVVSFVLWLVSVGFFLGWW